MAKCKWCGTQFRNGDGCNSYKGKGLLGKTFTFALTEESFCSQRCRNQWEKAKGK